MTRVDLLNAIVVAEGLTGRNAYHTMGSRRKHLGKDYPSEVDSKATLAAYLAHLDEVVWLAGVGKMGTTQLELILKGE